MPAKKSAAQDQHPLQWLLARGGEALGQAVQEVLARPGVSESVAHFATEAIKTKGKVDKNVETLLHALNLPTRADHEKLMRKLEHLQGSLVNLSIKLDRALAAQAATAPKAASEPEK